jgi:hypothetical protein
MDEDRYQEWREKQREKDRNFKPEQIACSHCDQIFTTTFPDQTKCLDQECIDQRMYERRLAADHELRKAIKLSGQCRKNPIYPSPSDFLYITDSTF